MYSFTGRVFPPMRRPLHLILHHLAVHLNVSTGGNLPPQLSDAGCERLYLLRIIGRGSFTLPAIERPALRRKSAIFSLQIFFVSQQFVKRCDLPFPQKIALPPIAIVLQEIIAQQVIAPLADFAFICFPQQCTVAIIESHKPGNFAAFIIQLTAIPCAAANRLRLLFRLPAWWMRYCLLLVFLLHCGRKFTQLLEVTPQGVLAEAWTNLIQSNISLCIFVAHSHMCNLRSVFHLITHLLQLCNKSGKAVCGSHRHFHIGFYHTAQRGCAFFFVFPLAVGFPVSVCFHNRQSIFAAQFIGNSSNETFETPRYLRGQIEISYVPYTAEWQVSRKSMVRYNDVAAFTTYGTDRASAYRLLEDALNLRDIRIYDTIEDADGRERRVLNAKETTLAAQKQQLIRDAFKDWIWKDPERRETLVRQYNEEMNSTRPREYDGSHIVFSGMNPEITRREHQKNAIAHVLYGGNTLLAHEVGAGKTFEMVASAMESKRLGLCQKSIFVVPNHLTEQWASEFLRLYPSANILVTTKKDFETHNRKKFCARIATGDYDAVIIGHSQFERMCAKSSLTPVCPQNRSRSSTTPIRRSKSGNCSQKSGVVRCAS